MIIKRKGFTLVELLIVIVVIGILSAMMMLSSTEAVTSAKVSNITSNLRNLKTAALALYTDSMDHFNTSGTAVPTLDDVLKYLGNGKDIPDKADYNMAYPGNGTTNPATWYIRYKINASGTEKTSIQNKLKGRAKSIGLLKAADNQNKAYDGGNDVYMLIR